ncbi:hypothetical protein GCM10028895_06970 [Pontibacter rugosus]
MKKQNQLNSNYLFPLDHNCSFTINFVNCALIMKKVAFYTLGCKLNYSETSTIGRIFQERGFEKVEFTDTPDIYVINTCSVTDNADKKCRKIVKEALKHSPNAFITIVGCYAQLKPKEISEIPGVDAVLGAAEKFQLVDILETFEKKIKPKYTLVLFLKPIPFTTPILLATEHALS